MQTKIISRVPETECYICGSADIVKLCHHCGLAMCSRHGPFAPPRSSFYNRIKNIEYTDLSLAEIIGHEAGIHCEYCNHYTVSYEPILILFAVVGAAFIISGLLTSSILSAMLFVTLGVATVSTSIWAIHTERQYRHYEMCQQRPPLPVLGRFLSVTVNESVKGIASLAHDGSYAVQEEQAKGDLKFSLQLTSHDQERLNKYRQKYKLPTQADMLFHAGFVVFNKAEKLYPENWNSKQINPIPLTGSVNAQPFFNETSPSYNRQWEHHHKYKIALVTQTTADLPVQIVPTLISEGEEWAFELYVQVNPKIDTSSLSSPLVEELVLKAPGSLGHIESHTPSARIQPDQGQDECTITWKNINLKQGKQLIPNGTFYVRFANSMDVELNDIEVHGQLRLRFEGAISGREDIILFSPLGNKRDQEEVIVVQHTIVALSFRFHLGGLHIRRFYSITESIEQLTAIPGSEMITRLVNAMSDRGIYIQRVIENPPHMNRANAQIMNRLWVIAGRRYKKATPIDFRVVVIGQEQYESTDKPYDGNTQFEITTQGTVIKESMCADIEELRDDIVEVIQRTPSLEIKLIENQLYVDEWGYLVGTIHNTGEVVARDVNIRVIGITVRRTDTIKRLVPGELRQFELSIYADKKGHVPITVTAICKDQFGQLPPHKKRHLIFVEEKPSSPIIGHQTIFHGRSTGPIHTGKGNIVSGHEQDDE